MQQAFKWLNMGGKLMVFGVANPNAVMEYGYSKEAK